MSDDEQEFIRGIRGAVDYWRHVPEQQASRGAALSGLAHSILCHIDGVSGGEACYDLIRKGYTETDDGREIEDEPRVLSAMFHELLYKDGWR